MHTLAGVSDQYEASEILLAPTFTDVDRRAIRRDRIQYVVVDQRDSRDLPNEQFYIVSGEYDSTNRTRPVSRRALHKLAHVRGVTRGLQQRAAGHLRRTGPRCALNSPRPAHERGCESQDPLRCRWVSAALAVALGAPSWLASLLTAVAFLLTAERLVRRRQLGWADAVASGAAGLLVVLMLLGFLLNEFPTGLSRVPWAVATGILALLAIVWAQKQSAPGVVALEVDRRALTRLLPSYVIGSGFGRRRAGRCGARHPVGDPRAGGAVGGAPHHRRSGRGRCQRGARHRPLRTGRDERTAQGGAVRPFHLTSNRHVRWTVQVSVGTAGRDLVACRGVEQVAAHGLRVT